MQYFTFKLAPAGQDPQETAGQDTEETQETLKCSLGQKRHCSHLRTEEQRQGKHQDWRSLLYQLWAEPTEISGSCRNIMFSPHHTQALVLGEGSKLLMQGTLQPFPDQQRQFPGSRGLLVAFPDLADEQHSTCQQPLSKPSQNSIIDLQCRLLFPASHWK